MFEIAPSEMLLFAIVAIVVIGPKDLPKAMRFVGKWVGKARGMARHFRAGLDTMMREAELEELEKQWREQNEAIMRAYPSLDTPATPPSGPDAGAPEAATVATATATPTPTPAASVIASAATPQAAPAAASTNAAAGSDGEKG